jgi:hypothetical protein
MPQAARDCGIALAMRWRWPLSSANASLAKRLF